MSDDTPVDKLKNISNDVFEQPSQSKQLDVDAVNICCVSYNKHMKQLTQS